MFKRVLRVAIYTLAITFSVAAPASGQADLTVDEAAARIRMASHDQAQSFVVFLPVDNASSQPIPARALLDLIDPSGSVVWHADQEVLIAKGSNTLNIPLSRTPNKVQNKDEFDATWARLRYSITPLSSHAAPLGTVEGIISAARIMPQLFDLTAVGDMIAHPGQKETLHVRATHPLTGKPIPKVIVQAYFDPGDDQESDAVRSKPATTDRDGFATLALTMPTAIPSDQQELDVTVTGALGGLTAETDGNIWIGLPPHASLSTDKSLYQPGQTLHMRFLAFDAAKKAIAGKAATIEVKDEEDTVQFAAHVQTSRFGIATADWQIPENLRLGTYQVGANFDDERFEGAHGFATVKVSRYELPNFSVTAKPDRAYYLTGQKASVEIRADYLFGKPVLRGHVRVVEETARKWNYRDQKWDIEEGARYEGDTDPEGRFVSHIDLSKQSKDLNDDDERFQDVKFAAYFTDSSTRRTEQRRFALRLSKQPIHVYVIAENYQSKSFGLPLEFFISTDYADGTPAPCEVDISWLAKPSEHSPSPGWETQLVRVHTDRVGLAKVSGLKVPEDPDDADAYLKFRAEDRNGLGGDHEGRLYYSDGPALRVATDKVLYQQGEGIEVTLTSNRHNFTAFVEALADSGVVHAQLVPMTGGRASLSFPPSDQFRDNVTIFAYAFGALPGGDQPSDRAFSGSRTVLFPVKHDLHVDIHPDQVTYRPGDQATVNFSVSGPEGQSKKNALGVVVVDKALEERQRADEDFGQVSGFYGFDQLYFYGDGNIKGISRNDLNNLNLALPLPEGMELAAEVLLRVSEMAETSFSSQSRYENLRMLFAHEMDPKLKALEESLDEHYKATDEYPKTLEQLKAELTLLKGPEIDKLRDPWGRGYEVKFGVSGSLDTLTLVSSGPDKTRGTPDDFEAAQMGWPYFKPHADAIQKAGNEYHKRTGGFIHDLPALESELKREGSDPGLWKDPWGHAYRYSFAIETTSYVILVLSAGPDGIFNTEAAPSEDDFAITKAAIDYSADVYRQIGDALEIKHYGGRTEDFPQTEADLEKTLGLSGIDWKRMKDPWGHRYYATVRSMAAYEDQITAAPNAVQTQSGMPHLQATPVTRKMDLLEIRSAGPDGVEGTQDDFTVVSFTRERSAQSSQAQAAVPRAGEILAGGTGAISGIVTDASGARIARSKVDARNLESNSIYSATADQNGEYTLGTLPPGIYTVVISKMGFKNYSITDVPVWAANVRGLDVTLQVGSVMQSVMVTAEAPLLESETTSVASEKPDLPGTGHPQFATPRLRDYFPETLLWQPEVITDGKGHAQIKFPLAGNITTWKLAAVASTVDGEIGSAEKEIRAFQPFFIEHDPPRVLTVGDEIDLPVVLRNYLDHPLQVKVEMPQQSWYRLANSAAQTAAIAAGDSSSPTFDFTAVSAIKQGKQRVTAQSSDASDAIEKAVDVHPDGQNQFRSAGQVFGQNAVLDFEIPNTVIAHSLEATLKIYPNLNAHVLESIEAIMKRPYGCAEQTISSAYPSLLYLQLSRSEDKDLPRRAMALHYLQLGYSRLLSYQSEGGGFRYWGGHAEPDPALTAYAMRFLTDAQPYVGVNRDVIDDTFGWLKGQAQPDGRWKARTRWAIEKEDPRESAQLTAYIALALVQFKRSLPPRSDEEKKYSTDADNLVKHALSYVRPFVGETDEPYLLAESVLASFASGDEVQAADGLNRLRKLEHREGSAGYWALELNTPFFGWGLPGRLEASALVVQALEAGEQAHGRNTQDDELISRGLLFLLKNQDQYGIWYSTQATIDVLQAITLATSQRPTPAAKGDLSAKSSVDVLIDRKHATTIDIPACPSICSPVVADLSSYLSAGKHRVEIRRPADSPLASLQLLAEYYIPWRHEIEGSNLQPEAGSSSALQLGVHYDKVSARPGQEVTCSVDAEMIGFAGYGMMLGEIGLPPGADVDRASLETARANPDSGIDQYDILPDRVVVYLWPRAGGTKFSFTFKPRYAMSALSSASVLYDYYNPEARAEAAPVRFVVR